MLRLLGRVIRYVLRRLLSVGIWRLPHGAHVTRYFMYRQLDQILADEMRGPTRVLAISGSRPLVNLLGLGNADIVEAHYPLHNLLNLRAFKDSEFDYVISDQVLEHLEGDPQKAFDETRRVLKPGGVAVHTTCFINPVHAAPSDFWRFTPDALRYLARDYAEIIAIGGWGNRCVWFLDWLGLRFTPVPHAAWHPINRIAMWNEPEWPIITWIAVKR